MNSIRKYLKTQSYDLIELTYNKKLIKHINTKFTQSEKFKFKSFLSIRIHRLEANTKTYKEKIPEIYHKENRRIYKPLQEDKVMGFAFGIYVVEIVKEKIKV